MVMDFGSNITWIILAAVVVAILAFLLLRPRQRVQLSDSAPIRPHMAHARDVSRGEGQGLPGELAAATSDIAGEILEAPVHSHLPGASGSPDNLQTLKGVGPKFAEMLNARGIIRYDQLARMSGQEVELLDAQLGPFRGRLQRDRVIEQADYLARGDRDGFEARFGSLSS
jgi:predicted flap endonuclease-1-like 5' DNA nuclease